MSSILLIEDNPDITMLIQNFLSKLHEITWANCCKAAMQFLDNKAFDLILLDIMLPDGDGYQVFEHIKKSSLNSSKPVIFLTAKNDIEHIEKGFNLGAEDYIAKPFDIKELSIRINAKLKKFSEQQKTQKKLGPFIFDFSNYHVIHQQTKEEDKTLTSIEFKLMYFLSLNAGKKVSRDDIFSAVWGKNVIVTDRSVDVYVANLRKKLLNKYFIIRSVYGVGYIFNFKDEGSINNLKDSQQELNNTIPLNSNNSLNNNKNNDNNNELSNTNLSNPPNNKDLNDNPII